MNRDGLRELLRDPRVRAFLRAIRLGEGTSDAKGYTRIVGGGDFFGFAAHPQKLVQVRPGLRSTAAGAYQFIWPTWQGLVRQYQFPDFSPDSQDEGAVALIVEKGAHKFILNDLIEDAARVCNPIWASLPGSPYNQPTVTMAQFMAEYRKWLEPTAIAENSTATAGKTARDTLTDTPLSSVGAAPIVESKPSLETYTTMPDPVAPSPSPAQQTVANAVTAAVTLANPIAGMLLQVARSLWPEVKPLFTSSGSEVAVRNVKAAEAVVGAIMTATGSTTPAGAMDAITTNPVAATNAREATMTTLQGFGVLDTTGVPDARKFAIELASNPNALKTPQFILSMYALTIVAAILGAVMFANTGLSGETKAAILFGSLTPLLGGLAFWFGTNSSNARKDELIAGR